MKKDDLYSVLVNLDHNKLVSVIRELISRSDGLDLEMPRNVPKDRPFPDLWQGYENMSKIATEQERIICEIQPKFSMESTIENSIKLSNEFQPNQYYFILLVELNEETKAEFISIASGKIRGFRFLGINDLLERLEKYPDLAENIAKPEDPNENVSGSSSQKGNIHDAASLRKIKEEIINSRDKNFWWLNAINERWSMAKMQVGDKEFYRTKDKNGKLLANVKTLTKGDFAIGYQGLPDQKIIGVCRIEDDYESSERIGFRLLYKFRNQTTYEQLKALDKFRQSPLAKNLTGSFKKLDYDVFIEILNSTELSSIETDDRENQTDSIPFHLDYIEEIDRLNREPIAKSLARLLNDQIFKEEKKIRHSFMIHLQGAWGDGKSTFLRLLSKHLKGVDENDDPLPEDKCKWIVVDFNAWRHQHIDPPWWIFMDTVYQEIQKNSNNKLWIWLKERWWRLITLNGYYWVSFLVFLGLFLIMMLVFGFKSLNLFSLLKDPTNSQNGLSVITSYISVIGSVWFFVKALSGSLIPATSQAANEFKNKVRDPMDVLKKHYEKLIGYSNKNVAVFIDDLDRCNAEFTVGLLEGIQTLFKEQAVLYVVAGDRHWISTCFENHYEKYKDVAREPAQRLGHLFLEKAFQLSIRLPKISGNTKKSYWDFILNPAKKQDKAEDKMATGKKQEVKKSIGSTYNSDELTKPENMQKIVEEHNINIEQATDLVLEVMDSSHEDIKHMLQNYHHLIDANPRGVKRLANQYTVYRNILIAEGRNFEREKLFRWLILQNKFPVYTDWLETHIDHYADGENTPEELQELQDDEKWKELFFEAKDETKRVLEPDDIAIFTGMKGEENNGTQK